MHAVTPADMADLQAARKAREQVEKATEISRSRWPLINQVTAYLRQVHEENHLADDLRLIFGTRRG